MVSYHRSNPLLLDSHALCGYLVFIRITHRLFLKLSKKVNKMSTSKYHQNPPPKELAFNLGYQVQMSQIEGWNNNVVGMASRETEIYDMYKTAEAMGLWDGKNWVSLDLEAEYLRGKNYARRIANSE